MMTLTCRLLSKEKRNEIYRALKRKMIIDICLWDFSHQPGATDSHYLLTRITITKRRP